MEEHVSRQFFILVFVVCFCLVTFVFIYNHHPSSAYMNRSDITPQKLCQILYEERGKPPEAFTYDKQDDGKYVIYRLDLSDGTYRRSIEDHPVDVDGFEWLIKERGKADVIVTKTGFTVVGLDATFNCPPRWSWNHEEKRCIEDPLCSEYNNSIIPLLNARYTEIENPATTIHTPLTGNLIHQKLYIECSKAEKKPVIKPCSENTFVKMSQEPYDKNNLSVIPPLENGEPNVNAICKRFDVCGNREDNTVHRFSISHESDKPLEDNEYFICEDRKSIKRKCQPNYKVNPNMEHTTTHICIPLNHCDSRGDFYFRIHNDSFGYCQSQVEYLVSCDGKGIFHMPDRSIECRNQKCLEPNRILIHHNSIFDYPYGVESCFSGNSRKKISCDEMFEELRPVSMMPNISLPRTEINRPPKYGRREKKYLEDNEFVIPTKFYYDTNTGKCEPFKANNIIEFLVKMKMIKEDTIIYKSTSHEMNSLAFRLKDNKMLLNPADWGFRSVDKVYAIFSGKIYCTGASNEGIIWNEDSKKFYSFISPIDVPPTLIGDEKEILDSVYDEFDGVYYGLCIKYHNKLTILDSDSQDHTVFRHSLTEFEDTTTHYVIPSASVENYQINYKNLISKGILSADFPEDQFSWKKLFIGKYFYDKIKNHFVIWHDHLFVISVKHHNMIINKTIDSHGQFIVDNFLSRVIPNIYHDGNDKVGNWNQTALVTTFNYFGHYFGSPAPFWLSFINIPVRELTEENVTDYLQIDYPQIQKNFIPQILISIIKMSTLNLNLLSL